MRFGEPLAFFWLLLVPLWGLLFIWLERRRARRIAGAGDPALLSRLVLAGADGGRSLRLVQAILLATAIVFSALALARPQLGMRTESRRARGIDLVVALDLSKSMLARDVVPSRLDRARVEINDLVDRLKGDRVGLVGFTSIALPLCPLTVDHGAFSLQLKSANPEDLPRGGTGIAEAIVAGQRMLTASKATDAERALLVITDGEDNEGDAIGAAKAAKEAGIAVHVVGVGSRTGEPIPMIGEGGKLEGYMKDRSGQTVVSRLNEKLLRDVADAGGGLVTLPSESGGLDLVPIRAHLSTLKKAELEERTVRVYEERYQFALVPALLFLILATLLRPMRRVARIMVTASFLLAASNANAAGPGLLEREDPDARAGNEALAAGKGADAVAAYDRAMARLGEDPRLLLDRGLASSSAGELDKAASDLRVAMESGKDPSVRASAAYALGNTYRKLKKYDDAIKAYQRSLVEDPSISGARRNLEITKRLKAIEALQPRDPNQKNEDGEKQQQPPQNQDGGTQPDSGNNNNSGDGGTDQQQDSGSDQSGADGGTTGDSGQSAEEQNAGEQDAGAGQQEQPQEEETQPEEAAEDDPEKKSAEETLDAVEAQEKALKRKRLLEKYRGKTVEKDW